MYKVTEIIDGDTFVVDPHWTFNGNTGCSVRIANFNAPEMNEPGGQEAKDELEKTLLDELVQLVNVVNFDRGRVVCDVHWNGVDVKTLL